MVSAGIVSSNASDLNNIAGNYMNQVNSVSSSWQGTSHDSFIGKCSDFNSEMQQVSSQMGYFAEAVTLFEQYKELKTQYENNVNTYNNQARFSNNQSIVNQFLNAFSDYESRMRDCANRINAALSDATSYKMEAASISSTSASSGTATGFVTSANGGEFVADSSKGVYGHIVSSIDGLEHTVYNQSQISGWATDCNRAAAASIASAYANYDGEAVDVAKQSSNGIGYKSDTTNNYFNQFGLTATVNSVNGSYDSIKNDLVSTLSQGNYVMFDLDRPNVHGASGQKWSTLRHWVSVLDIKQTNNGDYAIFVSDSGHGASNADHGLGAGWYSINEFDGQKIANFTTVQRA